TSLEARAHCQSRCKFDQSGGDVKEGDPEHALLGHPGFRARPVDEFHDATDEEDLAEQKPTRKRGIFGESCNRMLVSSESPWPAGRALLKRGGAEPRKTSVAGCAGRPAHMI